MAVPSTPNAANSPRSANKFAMTELKYRRIADLNQKLRDDYDRPRCKTSDACNKYPPSSASAVSMLLVVMPLYVRLANHSLIQYTKVTKDFMVPSVWGPLDKKEDPYAPTSQGGCCSVM